MENLLSALSLFSSSYFSEGNRISPREKRLAELVQSLREALGGWKGDKEWDNVRAVVNDIVLEAGLPALVEVPLL